MTEEAQNQANDEQFIMGRHVLDPDVYLISAPDLIQTMDGSRPPIKRGRILDLHQKKIFAPWPLVSLVARDPFDKFTGDQSLLSELLAQVEEVDD